MSSTGKGDRHDKQARPAPSLKHKAAPFVGYGILWVFLPVIGYVLHRLWGGDPVRTPLIVAGETVTTCGFAVFAYVVSGVAGRERVIRWHSTVTAALVGAGLTVTTVVGWPLPWVETLYAIGGVVAASWCMRRMDSMRSNESSEKPQVEPLRDALGLTKTRFGKPKHLPGRIEVPVIHGPGETAAVVQAAVPGIESVAQVPAGRSRVIPDPDNAGKSVMTIVTEDVLKESRWWAGPNAAGGCITEPIETMTYEDGRRVSKYIAGRYEGRELVQSNSNIGYAGVTRAGKTANGQQDYGTAMTRYNAVIWWSDKVKGEQTVGPLLPGLDVAVTSDKLADHKAMLEAVKRVVNARVRALGQAGYKLWTPDAFKDPNLRMPYLLVHFEEADDLLGDATKQIMWLTSKCLSAGISLGFSLQRPSHVCMPLEVRSNIGLWSVFGLGDDQAPNFVLSDSTLAAGAHPENWKNRKPGYAYVEGPGIDEDRWPIPARSDRSTDDMLARVASEWGPRMAPLDKTSTTAAGEWYQRAKGATVEMRTVGAVTSTNTPADSRADSDGPGFEYETGDEYTQAVAEVAEEVAELRAEGLIPAPPDGENWSGIDPAAEIPPPAPGTPELTWGKAQAPTAEAATEAFDQALRHIASNETFRQADGTWEFGASELAEAYPFRSRPWFVSRLTALLEGDAQAPGGLALERSDTAGKYRLVALAQVRAMHGGGGG